MGSQPVIAGTPVCPACERARDVSAQECPFCGVVYARYRPRLPESALEPVEEAPAPRATRIRLSLAESERFFICAAQALEAGLSLSQFVDGPALGGFPAPLRGHLKSALDGGATFSDALAEAQITSRPDTALLAAGETQGKLAGALTTLAMRYEATRKARRRMLMLLLYPTVLFVASNVILPLPTAVTEGVGAYLSTAVPPVLAVALIYVFAALVIPRLPPRALAPVRDALGYVPPISFILLARARATFAETLAAGVSAGLSMRLAVQLAADAAGHKKITPKADEVVSAIEDGATLADALRATGFYAETDLALIGHGEIVGKLDEVLPRVQAEHAQKARALTTAVIIGTSVVVLTAVVVTIAIAIIDGFSAYFGAMNNSIDGLFQEL